MNFVSYTVFPFCNKSSMNKGGHISHLASPPYKHTTQHFVTDPTIVIEITMFWETNWSFYCLCLSWIVYIWSYSQYQGQVRQRGKDSGGGGGANCIHFTVQFKNKTLTGLESPQLHPCHIMPSTVDMLFEVLLGADRRLQTNHAKLSIGFHPPHQCSMLQSFLSSSALTCTWKSI